MSIITKRGDEGQTDLMFAKRCSKSSPRIEGYGSVDELNAQLGVVRHSGVSSLTVERIDAVQSRLTGLMGELATLEEDLPLYDKKGYARISEADVSWIEGVSKELEQEFDLKFKGWARPGKEGNLGSAQLDLARTVCRRAERRLAVLRDMGDLSNLQSALFMNRLSDLCWLLARFEALQASDR